MWIFIIRVELFFILIDAPILDEAPYFITPPYDTIPLSLNIEPKVESTMIDIDFELK